MLTNSDLWTFGVRAAERRPASRGARWLHCLALLTLACTVRGEEPKGSDVPEAAHQETIRRGNHLEELGSTQAAGPEAVAVGALAPPEDDSDRWWINVITTKDVRYRRSCEQLLNDFSTNINLRAWADVDNPKQSWGHFMVRDIDEPESKDWLAGIREQLESQALPAIVLQPPRNGSYGRNSVTVGMLHGYSGDANQLSERIRAKIKTYAIKVAADKVAATQAALRAGHAQSSSVGDRTAVKPADAAPSRHPVEWPDVPPPKLTYKQVRALCPRASVSWVREQIKAGVATEDEVAEAYDEYVEGIHLDPKPDAKADGENPTQPASISLLDVLITVGFLGGIPLLIVLLWHRRARPTTESNGNASALKFNAIDESSTSNTRAHCVPFSQPSSTPPEL